MIDESKEYHIAVVFPKWYPLLNDIMEGILEIRGVRRRCHFRNFICSDFDEGVVFPDGYCPDGVISSFDNDIADASWLKQLNIPVVNIYTCERQDHASVGTDPASLAELVIDHFDSLSFDTVGCIATAGFPQSSKLTELFCSQCRARDIPFWSLEMPDGIMVGDNFDLDQIMPDLKDRLGHSGERVGIYTYHDMRGRILADYCLQKGLKIPEQVGILGRFDSINARLNTPELSSVVTPGRQMGGKAILLLIQLIDGEEPETLRITIDNNDIRTRESTAGHDQTDLEILRARSIIRDRACNGLTVDELVSLLSLSRSALEKRYRALRGVTPAQEIRQLRVEKASQLLRLTKRTVDEIAHKVGFNDPRPFVVFFKREAGMTPGEFRDEFGR
ncbi:MAG: helix-turn-helix domain-containing protein [Akkermansiaceae bacterium]